MGENHFFRMNPKILVYFLIAVDLEKINQMLILSNVMNCTSKFRVFCLTDLRVEYEMKINPLEIKNQPERLI